VTSEQGDQIGRIFAYWAIVYCGLCFENCRSSANFWIMYFITRCQLCIDFGNIILVGLNFGRLFHSSGHPASARDRSSNIFCELDISIEFFSTTWQTWADFIVKINLRWFEEKKKICSTISITHASRAKIQSWSCLVIWNTWKKWRRIFFSSY
jgi:hypothetical protein